MIFWVLKKIKENSLIILNDNEEVKSIAIQSCYYLHRKKAKELNKIKKAIIVNNVQEAVAKISNIFYRDFNQMRDF